MEALILVSTSLPKRGNGTYAMTFEWYQPFKTDKMSLEEKDQARRIFMSVIPRNGMLWRPSIESPMAMATGINGHLAKAIGHADP